MEATRTINNKKVDFHSAQSSSSQPANTLTPHLALIQSKLRDISPLPNKLPITATNDLFERMLQPVADDFLSGKMSQIWVGIDESALESNLKAIKSMISPRKLCAILKSDAYGHSATLVAPLLNKHVDYFGITEFSEAKNIHRSCQDNCKPILRIREPSVHDIYNCLYSGIPVEETIGSLESASIISDFLQKIGENIRINVHVNFNFGDLGRDGRDVSGSTEDLLQHAALINAMPGLNVIGICSHLSKTLTTSFVEQEDQVRAFMAFAADLEKRLQKKLVSHMLSSTASFRIDPSIPNQKASLYMDRIGASLFGQYYITHAVSKKLKPVFNACTFVASVHHRPYSSHVGYGSKYTVTDKNGEDIANLPIGWTHISSNVLNTNHFYIFDRLGGKHSVVGKPCMNNIMCKARANNIPHTLSPSEPVFITFGKLAENITETQDASSLGAQAGTTAADLTIHLGNSKDTSRFAFKSGFSA